MSGSSLLARQHALATPATQRERLAMVALPRTFDDAVRDSPVGSLAATGLDVLQVNVGKKCNQACHHCHVDAGPDRVEVMPDDVVDACLAVLERGGIPALDITGGAPELHPRFKDMITRARALGRRVMHRCNLTLLTMPAYRDLPGFLAEQRVELYCSLPSAGAERTNAQRGDGVFERSVAALRALNDAGFGRPGTGLTLALVSNPAGAFLPAPQAGLEQDFRRALRERHGVEFTHLLALANMPISRFLEWLERSGNLDRYMGKLAQAFNPDAVAGLMCRNTLSVAWDGRLYDCDFNQQLELPLVDGQPRTIFEFDAALLANRRVAVGPHCFGCTAGQGSSCGGATVTIPGATSAAA